MEISKNLGKIRSKINAAEKKYQREKNAVCLIAVSKTRKIEEIILATSSTVEGQTTAFYIQDSLKSLNIKISKLAQGLPVGGEIESLDDGTLISAFKNRKSIEKT